MFHLLVVAALCASCLAETDEDFYSFSKPVGGSSPTTYSIGREGRITGVRLWEKFDKFITGIQLRQDNIWSERVGHVNGYPIEIELHEDEVIVQVSGKHSNYIYQIFFVTSEGRFLMAGQPTTFCFNMYPTHPKAALKMLSGSFNSAGITSLGAHWGKVILTEGNTGNSSLPLLSQE